jgi:hypothetical protein
MIQTVRAELLGDATRYIWWQEPEQALRHPLRIVAQVMNLGDHDDVQRMLAVLGPAAFRDALLRAEPGWFSERSWGYWCYRLGITEPGDALPTMPARVFPDQAP